MNEKWFYRWFTVIAIIGIAFWVTVIVIGVLVLRHLGWV